VMHKPHSAGSANSVDDSAHPLTDDQAMAQVVQPAKEIVAAADLQSVSGGFSFASCNDQGDPPYMGEVTLSFLLRGDPDAYFQHVRAAMIASAIGGAVTHPLVADLDDDTLRAELVRLSRAFLDRTD